MPKLHCCVNLYLVPYSNHCVYTIAYSLRNGHFNQKPAYQKWYESTQIDTHDDMPRPITNIYEHLYQIPPSDDTDLPLAAISDKDSVWDKQRYRTEQVGDIYSYNAEFERYAERMTDCSTFLEYGFNDDGLKLKNANFCRVRHCPVCQWRRSLLWKSNMYVAYEEIKAQYPTHRWLFLTLTVKNCDITDLRETLQHMNKSWTRLKDRVQFLKVVDGWIRTTEVTKGKDGSAHPHFHVMLLVKPSYFAKNYIKQSEWSELWQSVLRVDYMPIIDVRAVKAKTRKRQEVVSADDAIKSAIMETLKYSVKPDDMIGSGSKQDNAWFYELTRQCFKLRFVASGGALKDALKRDEDITDDDLVNTNLDDEEDTNTDDRRLVFTYKKVAHKYLYNPKYNQ
jgi:plasmid rolling circle replication initiator protein Rep